MRRAEATWRRVSSISPISAVARAATHMPMPRRRLLIPGERVRASWAQRSAPARSPASQRTWLSSSRTFPSRQAGLASLASAKQRSASSSRPSMPSDQPSDMTFQVIR